MKTGYLAPEGFEEELERELEGVVSRFGRLFIADGPPQKVYWVQDVWFDPEIIPFSSVSEAARLLKERQKLWAYLPYQNIRRALLIKDKLAYFAPKPLPFPAPLPTSPLGSWTLIDANTLLAAAHCQTPFALGEVHFQENKRVPSRAYLKLWEFFLRTGFSPQPNEHCLELGASPGSWSWVLQGLGARVTAVDKAPLDPAIAVLPRITFLKKDAFSLNPDDFPDVDWVFSDLICAPEKLYAWLLPWLEAKPNTRFVCTLKFLGAADREVIEKFAKIDKSGICHLFHNKHELTWYRQG
jgi:23S rRNA (cytidine2498-2'-O)-methyltransferase